MLEQREQTQDTSHVILVPLDHTLEAFLELLQSHCRATYTALHQSITAAASNSNEGVLYYNKFKESMQACNSRSTEAQVQARSEEHTSELQSLMRISYAVFCLKKKTKKTNKKQMTKNRKTKKQCNTQTLTTTTKI